MVDSRFYNILCTFLCDLLLVAWHISLHKSTHDCWWQKFILFYVPYGDVCSDYRLLSTCFASFIPNGSSCSYFSSLTYPAAYCRAVKLAHHRAIADCYNKLCSWRHDMPPPLSPRGRLSASRAAEQTQRSNSFPRPIRSRGHRCTCLTR